MEQYDVVIIGSGLGGLETAQILATEGYSVCVLEKNRQYGGSLQIFSRDKVIFDTGVHYIGGLEEGQNLYQIFKYLDIMKELNLRKMDEDGFDKITFDGDPKEYNHAMGYERFQAQLLEDFPAEKEGISTYVKKLQSVCDHVPLYNIRLKENDDIDTSFMNIDAKSFIESCTSNKLLQNVLAGSNALYAGVPNKTPLYVHALVVNTYIESAWKCVDGGAQISRAIVRKIKDAGGVLFNYAKVISCNYSSGSISSVNLEDGRVIHGKKFISNIHPTQTMGLLDPTTLRKSYYNRMMSLENCISVFTMYLVFKPNSFKYLNHNYYHHNSIDAWQSIYYKEANWPESYALFVPATSDSEEYADSMNIMAYMRFDEVNKWKETFNTTPKNVSVRDSEYQDWKAEKCEQLLSKVEEKFPTIRQHIHSIHSSSPLSFRDYIGNEDGSLYGIAKDHENPLKTYISPRTKIPNLFLTGQNLNMHGILGVSVGSVVTASQFLGTNYLVKKILDAQ